MLAPSSGEVEGGVADDDAVAPLLVAVEDDAADDGAAAPLPLPGWAWVVIVPGLRTTGGWRRTPGWAGVASPSNGYQKSSRIWVEVGIG